MPFLTAQCPTWAVTVLALDLPGGQKCLLLLGVCGVRHGGFPLSRYLGIDPHVYPGKQADAVTAVPGWALSAAASARLIYQRLGGQLIRGLNERVAKRPGRRRGGGGGMGLGWGSTYVLFFWLGKGSFLGCRMEKEGKLPVSEVSPILRHVDVALIPN